MDLKITGHVIQLLAVQSGEGRNGPWRKQDFILETEGNYPKQVCITQWGDDIDKFGIGAGDQLTVHIDIQSREYQGRWYTDVKAWKTEKGEARRHESPPPGPPPEDFPEPPEGDEDLPF